MMVVRRARERRHERVGKQDSWLTFDPAAQPESPARGWGGLQLLNETRLPPGGRSQAHAHRDAEVITYVLEGSLAYDDSLGRSGVLHAGEFRRMTVGRSIRCTETNASRSDWVHVFQLWLHSRDAGLQPGHEQQRFSTAQRRGQLCLVASPDARMGSLRLREDALVYSALLERGHHMVHDLAPERGAWIQLVTGEVTLGDTVLSAGDGAGISGERPLAFRAREESEILLLDLAQRSPEALRSMV